MEELIELREYVVKEKEKASSLIKFTKAIDPESVWIKANKRAELAFSDIIERLDLILNNSVVKPSERRSPTDENFSGCKPPDERQNPQEEKSECSDNIDDINKIPFYKLCPECSCIF
jgi:hypothetical protein